MENFEQDAQPQVEAPAPVESAAPVVETPQQNEPLPGMQHAPTPTVDPTQPEMSDEQLMQSLQEFVNMDLGDEKISYGGKEYSPQDIARFHTANNNRAAEIAETKRQLDAQAAQQNSQYGVLNQFIEGSPQFVQQMQLAMMNSAPALAQRYVNEGKATPEEAQAFIQQMHAQAGAQAPQGGGPMNQQTQQPQGLTESQVKDMIQNAQDMAFAQTTLQNEVNALRDQGVSEADINNLKGYAASRHLTSINDAYKLKNFDQIVAQKAQKAVQDALQGRTSGFAETVMGGVGAPSNELDDILGQAVPEAPAGSW